VHISVNSCSIVKIVSNFPLSKSHFFHSKSEFFLQLVVSDKMVTLFRPGVDDYLFSQKDGLAVIDGVLIQVETDRGTYTFRFDTERPCVTKNGNS